MDINKDLLKRLTILYVEDEDIIRDELYQLLSKFFKKVFIAVDGKNGIEEYSKNKNEIDIILSDINMPGINGIDMVQAIRDSGSKVPVFFCTAHSDNEFLAQAIKLKVYEYIVKPIDIRHMLSCFSDLAQHLYQDFMINQQRKELEDYKEIVDTNNIVIKTDINMNITYLNELFCKSTGYLKEELLNKELIEVKHPDISKELYTEICAKLMNKSSWHGAFKIITKENGSINVDVFANPILDDSGELKGTIFVLKDVTLELSKKRDIQMALMKDKSDIFIRSKEGSAEQNMIINSLKNDLSAMHQKYEEVRSEKDKYIYTLEKYSLENRRLKSELSGLKKSAELVGDKATNHFKLTKENADLRMEVKKLNEAITEIHIENEKTIKQIRVNYDVEIDELTEKNRSLSNMLENTDSNEMLEQKLEYWKEKAKAEASRVEELEKHIMSHGDKSFMAKIFG